MEQNNNSSDTYDSAEGTPRRQECTLCKKVPPEVNLKHCAKCRTTPYCSRDCQKADWKVHKKNCGKQRPAAPNIDYNNAPRASTALSPPKGLDAPIIKPFTRLDNGTWLHDRPEKDVYRLLIDSFRMRVEDDYVFDQENTESTIYAGEPHSLHGFQRFLRLVASRRDLLPPWWTSEKKTECEQMGMDRAESNWYYLGFAIEKKDVIERYGDSRFPMQLRMFGEAVYGRGPGDSDGTMMRRAMVAMEDGQGLDGDMSMLTLDSTTMNTSVLRS